MSKVTISINKRGNDGYKVISVRLKEKTLKKIDYISAQSNRSRNEVVNILLESCIDDVEINWFLFNKITSKRIFKNL